MRRHELVLAVVAVVALAGCSGGSATESPMSERAQELQNQSTAAMQDVDTYRFDMSMTAEADQGSLSMDADGVLHRPRQRARMTMTMDGPGLSQDVTVYIVNQTGYLNAGDRWLTRNVSERNMWEQNTQLQRQRELLANSTLSIAGNTTIDGADVYVVNVSVPEDMLDELTAMAQQQSGTMAGSITDAEYTAYIAKASKLTRKIEADFAIEIQGESVDAAITMSFRDFGTATNITVPDAATEEPGSRAAVAGS